MPTIHCTRCGQARETMRFRPFPSELGRRVFDEICGACWAEWLKQQQALINHYGIDLRDPKAREFLTANLEQFLFRTPAEPTA